MKTSSCKAKGRKLQTSVAEYIVSQFPELQPDDVKSTSSGAPGIDVLLSPLAQRVFNCSVECKNTKVRPAGKALNQADYNAYPNTVPVVVWHAPRTKYDGDLQVIMTLENLVSLIKIVRESAKNDRTKD